MSPSSSREYFRAADQRLSVAEFLHSWKFNLDARYIGGYTVECSLKALILHLTPIADIPQVLEKISHGSNMHKHDTLFGMLRDMGVQPPNDLRRRMFRFHWDTSLRYETGLRDHGETTAFLRTAQWVHEWVKEQIDGNNGS